MIKYNITHNPEDCCGCRACEQICSKNAITFSLDEEGFFYPQVEESKCISCNLCNKVCPMTEVDKILNPQGKAYAYRQSDEEILKRSSSGGAFYSIASVILQGGGVVYGAAYKGKYVHHKRIDSIEGLNTLMGSKYVQSDIENTYLLAKSDLDSGRRVYYTGTPCQISGLKLFLRKDYDNLVTSDLVCHGTPSPKIFADTISHIEKRLNAKFKSYSFRDKAIRGWSICSSSHYEKKGKDIYLKHSREMEAYFKAFISGHLMRKNCFVCPFSRLERVGDITLADYWGVKRFHPEFKDVNKGMGLITVNTGKGSLLLSDIKNFNFIQQVDLDQAASVNKNLIEPSHYSIEREKCYDLFYSDYNGFVDRYYKGNYYRQVFKANIEYHIRKHPTLFRLISRISHL